MPGFTISEFAGKLSQFGLASPNKFRVQFQNVPVGVRLLGDQKFGREVDRAEMFLRNVGIPFEMVRVTDNPDDEDWDT